MATLVNKLNREVKVIIPNMREFSTFYSDKEGVLPMFFKRDWVPVKEEHWKPSEEYIRKDDLIEWINAQQEKLWELLPDADNDNPTQMELRYLGQYMQLEAMEDKVNEM